MRQCTFVYVTTSSRHRHDFTLDHATFTLLHCIIELYSCVGDTAVAATLSQPAESSFYLSET